MTDAEGAQPGTATTPSTSSATAVDADGASSTDAVKVGEERKDSCVPKFDALWFCYCEHQPRVLALGIASMY